VSAFSELHVPGRPLVLPNAWDFTSAAVLVDAGFTAIATTSLGVAGASGRPDGYGETWPETLALAGRLARLPCLLTVDIEGGFGRPGEVASELAALGVAGVNVEDGRPEGGLIPLGEQVERIAELRAAAPDLFVNARTDTHWLTDAPDLAATMRRLTAYVEAGADGVFVPGLADPADIRTVVAHVDRPLNVLALAGGRTVTELADLGVARISTGSLLFRAALAATVQTAHAVAAGQPIVGDLPTYTAVASLLGNSLPL
jgi:2-methylisocitrate lyase-like PEP mutase family enzyme